MGRAPRPVDSTPKATDSPHFSARCAPAASLPVDFHHLFAWPRFAIAPGHEHKGFVPFSHTFPKDSPHKVIQAQVLSLLSPTKLHLDRPVSVDGEAGKDELDADAVIIATGTRLSPPGTVPADDKKGGIAYFRGLQEKVEKADRIAILGGGAVGVRESNLSLPWPWPATDPRQLTATFPPRRDRDGLRRARPVPHQVGHRDPLT